MAYGHLVVILGIQPEGVYQLQVRSGEQIIGSLKISD